MSPARFLTLLKLARPRTWTFAAAMWSTAYLSTGRAEAAVLAAGMAICFLLTAATNLFNIYTDRAEDSVNLPHRLGMVDQIGLPALKVSIVFCYVVPLILAWRYTNVPHLIVCVAGALNSLGYSWGPRLKAHVFLSLAAISGVVILPFVAGWVAARPIGELSPIVAVFGLSFYGYANLKNLPDASGDRAAGVRTLFNSYSPAFTCRFVLAAMASPYVLLAALMAAGLLPLRYVFALPLAALPFWLVRRISGARSLNQKEVVHAFGFFYQISSLMVLLALYNPSGETLLTLLSLLTAAACVEGLGIDSRPYRRKPLSSVDEVTP
jgi:4-hydroxybenzoate polyprenyltransferase